MEKERNKMSYSIKINTEAVTRRIFGCFIHMHKMIKIQPVEHSLTFLKERPSSSN